MRAKKYSDWIRHHRGSSTAPDSSLGDDHIHRDVERLR
jgi:hypothetical protein